MIKKWLSQEYIIRYASLMVWVICAIGGYREVDEIYWASLNLKHLFSLRLAPAFFLFFVISGVGHLVWAIEIWSARWALRIRQKITPYRQGAWIVIFLLAGFNAWFLGFSDWGAVFSQPYIRLIFLLGGLGICVALLPRDENGGIDWGAWLGAVVLFGSAMGAAYLLRSAPNYPFGLSWSEGNRLWDYSVLYGRNRYIYPVDQPIEAYIDPGRQSLWGLPFLFPWADIKLVRLWSAAVFSVPYMVLGWFVFQPQKRRLGTWLLLGLFTYLFLQQGPIYSPLVLAAILVAGARRTPYWIGLLLVGLSGYYAATSRYTWMAAPAAYAFLMFFLQPDQDKTAIKIRSRWLKSIGMGLAGMVGGFVLPTFLPSFLSYLGGATSTPVAEITDTYTTLLKRQPLLWDRLLPNETYPPGILLGLAMAAGAFVILLGYLVFSRRWNLDFWQKLALGGIAGVFLAVGLVVSVKIGGGSNLHNLDMFFITLIFASALAWESGGERWVKVSNQRKWWGTFLLVMLVLYPSYNLMREIKPVYYPDKNMVNEAIDMIQNTALEALKSGEVLFMDQRQLLTFGYVKNIPLVPEYEKKHMMDEAMADNARFFQPFYRDIERHRFSLILSEPLETFIRPDEYHFGNENNAWVNWVSKPLLCYYEPLITLRELRVQLLVPRKMPCQ